jgi:hypothetical protein
LLADNAVDAGSVVTPVIGTVWKYVPFSPAGFTPKDANVAARYSSVN